MAGVIEGYKISSNAKDRLNKIKELLDHTYEISEELRFGFTGGRNDADFSAIIDALSDIEEGCMLEPNANSYQERMEGFSDNATDLLNLIEEKANLVLSKYPDVREEHNQGARQALRFVKAARSYVLEFSHEMTFDTDKALVEMSDDASKMSADYEEYKTAERKREDYLELCYFAAGSAGYDFESELRNLGDVNKATLLSYKEKMEREAGSSESSYRERMKEFEDEEKRERHAIHEQNEKLNRLEKEGPQMIRLDSGMEAKMNQEIRDLFTKTCRFQSYLVELDKLSGNYIITSSRLDIDFRKSVEKLSPKELDAEIKKYTPEKKSELLKQYEAVREESERLNATVFFANQLINEFQAVTNVVDYDPEKVNEFTFKTSQQVLKNVDCDPLLFPEVDAHVREMRHMAIIHAEKQKEYMKNHNGNIDMALFNEHKEEMQTAFTMAFSTFKTKDHMSLLEASNRYNDLSKLAYDATSFDKKLIALKGLKEIRFGENGYITKVVNENKEKIKNFKNDILEARKENRQRADKLEVMRDLKAQFKAAGALKVEGMREYMTAVSAFVDSDRNVDRLSGLIKTSCDKIEKESTVIENHDKKAKDLAVSSVKEEFTDLYEAMSRVSMDRTNIFGHKNTDLFNTMMTSLNRANDIISGKSVKKNASNEERRFSDEELKELKSAMADVSEYVRQRVPKNGKRFKGTDQGQMRYDAARNLESFFKRTVGDNAKKLSLINERETVARVERNRAYGRNAQYETMDALIEEKRERNGKIAENAKKKFDAKLEDAIGKEKAKLEEVRKAGKEKTKELKEKKKAAAVKL